MRTEVSYHGKEVLAICLDDISYIFSNPTLTIRQQLKETNMGKHNIPKDFVPADSINPIIKRKINSYSRKCTVIWLDTLPQHVQEQVKRGN